MRFLLPPNVQQKISFCARNRLLFLLISENLLSNVSKAHLTAPFSKKMFENVIAMEHLTFLCRHGKGGREKLKSQRIKN